MSISHGLAAIPWRERFSMALPRRARWVAAAVAVGVVAVALAAAAWFGFTGPQAQRAVPPVRELLPVLTRSGVGPADVSVDVVYAPPVFFRATEQDPPRESLSRPTLIFYLQESVHLGALPEEPPAALLRVDGGERLRPYRATVVQDDIHHRTTQLLFPGAGSDGRPLAAEGTHTLALVIPLYDGAISSGNTLVWELPLALPGEAARAERALPDVTRRGAALPEEVELSSLSQALQRTRKDVQFGGVAGIEVAATYATPQYFSAALPPEAAERYRPERALVFLVSESAHDHDLPEGSPPLSLRIQGRDFQPDLVDRKVSSPHHRVTMVRFPAEASLASQPGTMELRLPDGTALQWQLPVTYAGARELSPFGLSWPTLLAMFAGMLAAMWPCLFQLTAFFIPSLAGISMREAGGQVSLGSHLQVLRAAFFFVLGFTLVYTAAGAAVGLAAEHLKDATAFETWQRYVSIGGGVAVFVLALRVAARARAPLVCKMPVLSGMAHKRGGSGPLEMMLAGLAFATGCMTCFGAALVLTMMVYVGLHGSVAFGALIMFLFSLGMGIPLVIAATAMARVLPLLFRLEKVVPWMALGSSVLMMGFSVLLISGNYMALTEWVFQLTRPLGP